MDVPSATDSIPVRPPPTSKATSGAPAGVPATAAAAAQRHGPQGPGQIHQAKPNMLHFTILEFISLTLYAISLTTLILAGLLLHKSKDKLAVEFTYLGLCGLMLANLTFISTSFIK